MLIVLDGILGGFDEESLVRRLPEFIHLGEVSSLTRLTLPECETPESLLLGMNPNEGQLRQGPLTVSGLGWDPPDRSTHFHLSLLSVTDTVSQPIQPLSPDEQRVVKEKLNLLKTKKLTTLWGHGFDHGLVWERLAEVHTHPPETVTQYRESLPEGDGEPELRRFIDDSVNLLLEEEFNLRRIDQGVLPVNLAWPWANGVRLPVTNLALRYGFPFQFASTSLRLAGLARLAGFRHGNLTDLGQGLQTNFNTSPYKKGSVVVFDVWRQFRIRNLMEEAEYLARKCGRELLAPLLDKAHETQDPLWVILKGQHGALGLTFTGKPVDGFFPLDERSLSESRIPSLALHEFTKKFYDA